jgi:hypothetical protein
VPTLLSEPVLLARRPASGNFKGLIKAPAALLVEKFTRSPFNSASVGIPSSTDAASYGDLYQWGRAKDGHENRASGTTTTAVTTANPGHGNFIAVNGGWTTFGSLWQAGLNDPCPTGYRMPTEAELNGERLNFPTNNAAGAFNSSLKLSVAGHRASSTGSLVSVGTAGYYWSSTVLLAFYNQ